MARRHPAPKRTGYRQTTHQKTGRRCKIVGRSDISVSSKTDAASQTAGPDAANPATDENETAANQAGGLNSEAGRDAASPAAPRQTATDRQAGRSPAGSLDAIRLAIDAGKAANADDVEILAIEHDLTDIQARAALDYFNQAQSGASGRLTTTRVDRTLKSLTGPTCPAARASPTCPASLHMLVHSIVAE